MTQRKLFRVSEGCRGPGKLTVGNCEASGSDFMTDIERLADAPLFAGYWHPQC